MSTQQFDVADESRSATTESSPPEQAGQKLARNLKLWQVVAISIGVMAPSFAITSQPQFAAASVGRAAPLSYLLALVGVLTVAYGLGRLSQRMHHPGAVYGLVGASVGPRTGVVAAWALAGTYFFLVLLCSMAVGIFGCDLLENIGVWHDPPSWAAYLLAVVTVGLSTWLGIVPARRGTSIVIVCEAITVLLITLAAVIVLVRLASGTAPTGNHIDFHVFVPEPGSSPSALFVGIVMGFLSFAGFEAAAVAGAEAENPRKNIPRAIVGTTVVIGLFYVFIAATAMMGFGTSPGGVDKFTKSPSLMGDLGTSYVGHGFGNLITVGTIISAASCALACAVGAARIIYTLAFDATEGKSALASVSTKYATPWSATAAVGVTALAALALFGWGMHADAQNVFDWTATIGTLLLLVVYLLATVGALRVLFFNGPPLVRRWEIVIPLMAMAILVFTLYKNIHPTGTPIGEPITAVIWILLAALPVLIMPAAARKLGKAIRDHDGMRVVPTAKHPTPATGAASSSNGEAFQAV
jgi:amino acid transporter